MHLTERTLNSFTQFLSIGFTFLEISSVFITQCKLNITYFQYPFMLHFYLKGCLRKRDSCLQNTYVYLRNNHFVCRIPNVVCGIRQLVCRTQKKLFTKGEKLLFLL